MSRPHYVVHEGGARDPRLEKLGIPAKIITMAVEAGEAEARQCTDNDPVMARGFIRYFRTVRTLREGAAPLGWGKDNPRNLARTLSPDRKVAIVTALGDERTGDPLAQPSTKYHKGPMMLQAVGDNVQLELFTLPEQDPQDEHATATWILLYHLGVDEIRYELSLPVATTGGRLSGWQERILFPAMPREPQAHLNLPPEEFPPDIDILVARR
ncbi:hypothetical protein AB0B31_11585 [Catellatospora citrea]|uniref:hypothetical protein n=1 Tax=Catellatospora citrea TaxID=53366 RepID=UPI0033C7726D